ncbi:fumarylacetoacetate hydrolase family protein [Pararobbsia alpina]|uniref:Ureidoglycolate lyase n=1 Tax=Pararobbsia alpina TaxID=621374 RepID=A0A6S7DHU1_9BURK|nr:fumarylacetoacetate hydrolase family protein [Pararobbsia alpina]CAB3807726.1 Ureidoglycolate lyase [Pararobbsia alpina]
MKLLRYGPQGQELPAILAADGSVRALSPIVKDIDESVLSPDGMRFLEALDPLKLPKVDTPGRIGSPLGDIKEIIAVGLNYRQHAMESNLPIPLEPVVFFKSTSSICGPGDDILLPPGSTNTDWEIELGIVIGSSASRIDKSEARKCIAGYVMVNDVSERHWQVERGGQWSKGKSFDTFTPVGPWLASASELESGSLELKLDVNGAARQRGNTADLIFDVDTIVSYCSHFMTLRPGHLIITGTPAGVGFGMTPRTYLAHGDVVDMSITGLGTQRHLVRAA